MTAICPAGPPKVCRLIRNQAFAACPNGMTSPVIVGVDAELDVPSCWLTAGCSEVAGWGAVG